MQGPLLPLQSSLFRASQQSLLTQQATLVSPEQSGQSIPVQYTDSTVLTQKQRVAQGLLSHIAALRDCQHMVRHQISPLQGFMALRQLQLHALLLCDVVHNDQHCRLACDGVLQQHHTWLWMEHGCC